MQCNISNLNHLSKKTFVPAIRGQEINVGRKIVKMALELYLAVIDEMS
jgi:hypothetical protein